MTGEDHEVATIQAGSKALEQVLALHKQHKRWLGPLPDAAFSEAARQGTLLGAVDNAGRVVGYVLYRLPRNAIALTHLCIATSARASGLARRLIDELQTRHPDRAGIRLRCRRDWPANDIWPKLDFEPCNNVPGKSQARNLLTIWWRDFGHPTLFSGLLELEGGKDLAALDTDVYIDLGTNRAGSTESQALLSDWLLDEVDLVVTKVLAVELNRNPDDTQRAVSLQSTGVFARIDSPSATWKTIEMELRAHVAPGANDHHARDIENVARAAGAGATYFVTRDDKLRKRLRRPSEEICGIKVVRPAELVRLVLESRQGTFDHSPIQGTSFEIRQVTADDIAGLTTRFCQHGSERSEDLRDRLFPALARPDTATCELISDPDGEPSALVVREQRGDHHRVTLLRVVGPYAPALARQIAHRLRDDARAAGKRGVVITDPRLSPKVTTAVLAENYLHHDDCYVAATIDDSGSAASIVERLEPLPWYPSTVWDGVVAALVRNSDTGEQDQLEALLWPLRVLDGPLATWLVPIRPHFADALFDTTLNAQTLFARPTRLGMSREHVYYRSPVPRLPVQAPARIAWYVTKGSTGTMSIRAVSRLREVTTDRVDTLYHRYRHLGVWTKANITSSAKDGRAVAMRFSDTELLENPVGLDRVRDLARELDCRAPHVRSPWLMPPELFAAVYQETRR